MKISRIAFLIVVLVSTQGAVRETNSAQLPGPDVIVDVDTIAETPLNPGFSGFNSNLKNDVEYDDLCFQQILKTLSPGWLRFPGGTESEAFNWQSGEIESSWVSELSKTNTRTINENALPVVAGKGGASFIKFAAMAHELGAKIIVSVNAYTDTPQSARAFAKMARENNIPVAVWELANEPYTWLPKPSTPAHPTKFKGQFFTSATDYADQMKKFRDKIKEGDPNAVVSLYFSEAGKPHATGSPGRKWDDELASYPLRYWDAVTYHEYVHPQSSKNYADLVKAANGNLLSKTTQHVTDYLVPRNELGMTYVISEVSPSSGEAGKGLKLLGTLYGGIYTAEFALRMSVLPQVKYVSAFQVLSPAGIDQMKDYSKAIVDAYEKDGTTTDTTGRYFGFFLSAQAAGEAVANGALSNSIGVYATTTTGGPTELTDGSQDIPSVYAQAYEGENGKRYVVLTNKHATPLVAEIRQNGMVQTRLMDMTFVTGTTPEMTNVNPPPGLCPNSDPLQAPPPPIQTQKVTDPGRVTIPPYSVVRLEWIFDTAPPVTTAQAHGSTGNDPWYVGPITVDFSATDDLSGVVKTEYSKDNGANWKTGASLLLKADAIHHILYRSVDLDGNVETPKAIILKLDSKPPTTTVSKQPLPRAGLEVTLRASDDLSGVAKTEYSLDNGSTWKTKTPFFLCGGTYTVVYRSTDVAGNMEKRGLITLSAETCSGP